MTATIYEDRDNSFTVILKKNDELLTTDEMTAITKFEIKYRDAYYNSVDNPSAFTINLTESSVTIKPYELRLTQSSETGDLVEFIVYDSFEYTHGLVWDQFTLIVKSDAKVI